MVSWVLRGCVQVFLSLWNTWFISLFIFYLFILRCGEAPDDVVEEENGPKLKMS